MNDDRAPQGAFSLRRTAENFCELDLSDEALDVLERTDLYLILRAWRGEFRMALMEDFDDAA